MMTDVACFCGCLFSFDGATGGCPKCGEVASLIAGPALGSPGRNWPEHPVPVMHEIGQNGQTPGTWPPPGRDLVRVPFPVMRADEVAGAALAGLRLGEIVCVPGLPDPSMLDTVSQAQQALFMTAVGGGLAGRYAPVPRR